jgi:hypothetical protein
LRRGWVRRDGNVKGSYLPTWRYSQLRRAKKKASRMSWWKTRVVLVSAGMEVIVLMRSNGMASWCWIPGSVLRYPRMIRVR